MQPLTQKAIDHLNIERFGFGGLVVLVLVVWHNTASFLQFVDIRSSVVVHQQ